MQWRFNRNKINKQFKSFSLLNKIMLKSNIESQSPYDGIKLYSNDLVSQEFWNLVKPAVFLDPNVEGNHYRYLLNHPLFVIQWGKIYNQLPNTIITVNPHTNLLTPVEMLDLVTLILGDYKNVKVGSWDEQIDINEYNSHEVAKRLWASYLRKDPYNPPQSNRTYYYNQRSGNQTKVYNKAKELGIKQQLTRIEKTHKVEVSKRLTLTQFLHDERNDVFKHLKMLDIDKLDGRSRVKKLINSKKTLMHVYRKLSGAEQKRFKRHPVFLNQCIDIHAILKSNIQAWLSTSPLLRLKLLFDQSSDMWKLLKRTKLVHQKLRPVQTHMKGQLQGWTNNKREITVRSSVSIPLRVS